MTYTFDDNSKASNPGRIRVNPIVWYVYHPWQALLEVGLLFCITTISLLYSFWFFLLILVLAYFRLIHWIHLYELFWHSNSTPGIVICSNSKLVGVLTNLSKSSTSHHVFKVIKIKSLSSLKKNQIIPFVSSYEDFDSGANDYWKNFNPIALHYVTWWRDDKKTLLKYYGKEDIDLLKDISVRLKVAPSIGLYRLRLLDDDWKSEPEFLPYEIDLRD